jgi:dihydroflavonol-4-reductase
MLTVVTGASGHIGGNLVRALLEQGRRLRVTVRQDTRAIDGLQVVRVPADVLDPASLRRAFEGAEVVFHLAAVISITGDPAGTMQQTNIDGVRNVVEACLACGVRRLIHFSSIHALSHRPEAEPIDETRSFADGDAMAYDRTKAGGEQEVHRAVERGLDAVIVNPTAVIGPYDYKPSPVGQVLLDLYQRNFPALVAGGFDWVDVRDVVAGALAAEERGRTGERYLLSGKWASVADLARVVQEVTGVPAPRFVSPMWLARIGAPFVVAFNRVLGRRPLYTSSSLRALRCHRDVTSEKAKSELCYSSRPLRETVEDTIDWFESAGMLRRKGS